MAGIDKIYLNKNQANKFIEYLKSIDYLYKQVFYNSHDSLLDYCFDISNYEGSDIPVTNFPEIIDKWLIKQNDLPEFVKEYMITEQYNMDWYNEVINTPIEDFGKISNPSNHFIVIKQGGFFTNYRKFYKNRTSKIFYQVSNYCKPNKGNDIYDIEIKEFCPLFYYPKKNLWINAYNPTISQYGLESTKDFIEVGSYKALIRKMRNWILPKNTYIILYSKTYIGYIIFKFI